MDINNSLKRFILTEVMFEKDEKLLGDDKPLLELGVIDSMGIVVLMSFMEQQFGIEFEDEDMVPENFQTINDMKDLIERKLSSK